MSKHIKCRAKLGKILFPKTPYNTGEFAIVSMKIVEELVGEVEVHSYFETFTVKGDSFCKMNHLDTYIVTMTEGEENKYGKQYNLVYINPEVDLSSVDEQKIFFSAVLTPKQTEALYSSLPDPLSVIKSNDIETLCTVKGIREKTAKKIIERYESTKDNANLYVELASYHLTNKMIKKLLSRYKSADVVIEKIKENIYTLADEIDGVGFKRADEIARSMGMALDDPRRITSYIRYYLNQENDKGNSWVYTSDLLANVYENCGEDLDIEVVRQVMTTLREKLIIVTNKSRSLVALKTSYDLEIEIMEQIDRIASGENNFVYDNWKEVVYEIEERQGWKHTDEQFAGIKTVLDNQVTVVTGLAGTGKSTVTNAMIKILTLKGYNVIQCALSGRASQRMKEVNGMDSATIHRTLGIGENGIPLYDEFCPVDADVILVDEASMIDGKLFLKLLKAVRTGSKLVIIGDKGQLPSIGSCNVFFDLLGYDLALVELTTVHRQAQASAIISKSIDIRKQIQLFGTEYEGDDILGELKDLELNIYKEREYIPNRIIKQFMKHYEAHEQDIMKVQIVVPMKARGNICTQKLNQSIQAKINPALEMEKTYVELLNGSKIYVGDKVINNRNAKAYKSNEDEVQIFNGNIGIVKDIDILEETVTIWLVDLDEEVILEFDHVKEHVDLGYAITCHKLQGSSANTVIVGMDYSAYALLSCEWLYTALTRAEKYCILVAENNAVRHAISKTISSEKQTFIKLKNKQQ